MFYFKFLGTFTLFAFLNFYVDNCLACVSVFDSKLWFVLIISKKMSSNFSEESIYTQSVEVDCFWIFLFQFEYHLIVKIDFFIWISFKSNTWFLFHINIEWVQNASDIGGKLRGR